LERTVRGSSISSLDAQIGLDTSQLEFLKVRTTEFGEEESEIMKRYTDYGKGELASLTEDQIQLLVELEIAEAGIKPAPQPIKPSAADVGITASEVFFQVSGGGYRDELVVKTEAEANQIAAIPIFKKEYNFNIGDKYQWAEPGTVKVSQISLYKQEDVRRVSGILQEIKVRDEQYNKENTAYQKYLDATGKCRNSVWTAVHNDRKYVRTVELTKQTWEKHLRLANGDKEIAERFFRNAYKDEPELIEAVLGVPVTATDPRD
jgi:hypothetical protein